MDERKFIATRFQLCRDIDNLKNALEMFGGFIGRLGSDATDEIAKSEGALVKAICKKVTTEIDDLFDTSK